MSIELAPSLPMGNSPARAQAKETIWRLVALSMAHPTPEFYATLTDNRFQAAFDVAWRLVNGRPWHGPNVEPDYATFESGYIHAFLHGFKGRPVAPIHAGEYEQILAGLSRPVFMLNLTAFYKHFGLQAATEDEGRQDEPDHLAVMSEFMAVLCYLEARALSAGKDASPYRRAQRDFLSRYLASLFDRVNQRLARHDEGQLDPCLRQILADMADWARQQIGVLEASVGAFRDPDAPKTSDASNQAPEMATQNLWG